MRDILPSCCPFGANFVARLGRPVLLRKRGSESRIEQSDGCECQCATESDMIEPESVRQKM